MVNGVLKKGMSSLVIRLNGLVPDQTPVLDRKYSFMLKVMAAAEAYAMSLYSLTTPGMQGMSIPSNSRSEAGCVQSSRPGREAFNLQVKDFSI
jgi:hypothetical protein